MAFLYETIDSWRSGGFIKEIPTYLQQNISPNFELRPYQISAFENFISYFENERVCPKPTQTLFHMATGSGKTMMMAGLILYLYKKGYRNFLFFVNLSNIVQKTKENFFNATSSKYLFAEEIVIDGEKIKIKEVSNFQAIDNDAINICFTTTQGLHSDMWNVKENAVSIEDFQSKKVVLISDEAHHLNADTKKKMTSKEEDDYKSWEYTVGRIFSANKDNILLEFTATCDLNNPFIKAEYESKIIFDYPLHKYRDDKYSKEIKTLRSDVTIMERAIQAIIISQYRLKVFEDHRLAIKPVVLFKAAKIEDSKNFMDRFISTIANITGEEIERIFGLTQNETLMEVFKYFSDKGISLTQLAQELKEEFSFEHCISANDDKESFENQVSLNSLEDKYNPYRAVFEVKKLDEGWDVLNLFDIVRLYETRQSGRSKISSATISEAQLIGRGSRYCPFQLDKEQEKYKRKYDNDLDNPLRICEELYYHCQDDSRYIYELHNALREIGIDLDKTVTRQIRLKEEFKQDSIYKNGYVFTNEKVLKSRNEVDGLLPSIRSKIYAVTLDTGKTGEDTIMNEKNYTKDDKLENYTFRSTLKDIAEINYSIIQKAMCKHNVYKFNTLKSYFPNLKSTREFVFGEKYLGGIRVEITTRHQSPSPQTLHKACVTVLGRIAGSITGVEEVYEGTKEFVARNICDIFKDKRANYSDPHDGGIGISQNDINVPKENRMNLLDEDWFAFDDNYGTSEEKAFVAYFKSYAENLKAKYDKVYLLRNERQLAIYSFGSGERFEPDYLLFLHSNKADGYEQLQVFIEPKGSHLLEKDSWKEDFLLELEHNAVPITKFADDNNYKIWGFQFFNQEHRSIEFANDMAKL